MNEKEKKIMETLAKVVKGAPESRKDYLLGWAEGAASMSASSFPAKTASGGAQ